MEGQSLESPIVLSLRRNVLVASIVVTGLGFFVMLGWFLDIPILKSISPDYVTMKFNTAACFVMGGTALWCLLCESRALHNLGKGLAMVVFVAGAVSFSEYLWNWDAGIDNLFIPEPANAVATVFPGRMSAVTAIAFMWIGLSLLPVNTTVGWRLLASQVAALATVFCALLVLTGYAYGQSSLYSFGTYSTMAVHTALAFLVLGLGIVATRPHCYLMRHITSEALGGVMARRLIPFAILTPIFLGWMHLQWGDSNVDRWRMGESMEVLSTVLIFVLVVVFLARSLNRIDITSRQREEEKREGEERLQMVGKALSDAVMDWNLMTNAVWYSESFYTFFGYSPREKNSGIEFWEEGIHPEDKTRVLAEMKEFVGGGQEYCSCEYRFHRKNGAYANILGRGYLVRDRSGRAVHMVCAMLDMTKRKKREQDQLKHELMENRYQFISMVSHELRSPLTVISGCIEMACDETTGPLNDQQRQHLEMARHHVERLNRLVSDVLDYQKMETGHMLFQESFQEINTIVGDIAHAFQEEAKKKGMQIDLHLEPKLPKVFCDKDAMEQVLSNLLSNAIKYSGHGHVEVTTNRVGDKLRVAVHDEGIGIRKEDQVKLFQNFFRVKNSEMRKVEGTGLGLAICKKIVDACHGKIGVESEPGRGSTFYFTLPVPPQDGKVSLIKTGNSRGYRPESFLRG